MTGVFDHSIDAKGRLFIPSRLREKLGEEFQIAVGRDFSLTLYPLAEWEALRELVNKEPDAKKRETSEMIFAYSVRCSVDAQNRVMIPPNLREYALLEKDVTVVGANRVVRIWNTQRWNAKRAVILTPERLEELNDTVPL